MLGPNMLTPAVTRQQGFEQSMVQRLMLMFI
jgi:hypothetical protein